MAVSFSDKPSLATYCFHLVGKYIVLSNSAGLLKPHSLREVSGTPITPCSPISTLSFLVSSLRRLSFLPSWLRSYGVEFPIAPHQNIPCRSCCSSSFASFLCCPSSFAFTASLRHVLSFLSYCSTISPTKRFSVPLSSGCVSSDVFLTVHSFFFITQNTRKNLPDPNVP